MRIHACLPVCDCICVHKQCELVCVDDRIWMFQCVRAVLMSDRDGEKEEIERVKAG